MEYAFRNLLAQIRAQDDEIYSRHDLTNYAVEKNFSITAESKVSGEKILLGEYESGEEAIEAIMQFAFVANTGAGIFAFPQKGFFRRFYSDEETVVTADDGTGIK